jgi:hypothetical protein
MDTGTTEAGNHHLVHCLGCGPRQRHRQHAGRHRASSPSSLIKLDKEVPADLEVHLILDNHATDKTEATKTLTGAPPAVPPALNPDQQQAGLETSQSP